MQTLARATSRKPRIRRIQRPTSHSYLYTENKRSEEEEAKVTASLTGQQITAGFQSNLFRDWPESLHCDNTALIHLCTNACSNKAITKKLEKPGVQPQPSWALTLTHSRTPVSLSASRAALSRETHAHIRPLSSASDTRMHAPEPSHAPCWTHY